MFKFLLSFAVAYDYHNRGDDWQDYYCKMGEYQSPIVIDRQNTVGSHQVSFKMSNYQDITNATLTVTNNGIRVDYPNE
jgi:carbonic anhydrase